MPQTDNLPHLTPAELDVIRVLWQEGRLSARELHERISQAHDWAYSTTRTTVDRMVAKGVLDKVQFHGLNLYTPAISRAEGLARLVRDFARDVLGASPAPVVSLFAEAGTLSEQDLDELRRLVVHAPAEEQS